MKNYLPVFVSTLSIIFLILSSANGQQTYLKAYSNSFFFEDEPIPDLDLPSNGWWRFRDISLAITWRAADSSYFETELSRFRFRQETDEEDYDLNKKVFSLRFEYGQRLNIFTDWKKGTFYLGGSVRPYYARVYSEPPFSTDYPTTWRNIGAVISLIPRFEFPFHERWFLDINIVLDMIHTAYTFRQVENPLLTENQQIDEGLEMELGRVGTGIRVGFAYQISRGEL